MSSYVGSLVLSDLFASSACLRRDWAANRHFLDMIEHRVKPPLVRRFQDRLARGKTEEVVDNVVSHCWIPKPRESEAGESEELAIASGENGDLASEMNRLAGYLGTSTLMTWVYTIAHRALLDELRHRRSRALSLDVTIDRESGSAGNVAATSGEADADDLWQRAQGYLDELRSAVTRGLAGLREAKNPRLYYVAFLWLPCRTRQKDIAALFEVTKPRISQQTKEICDCLLNSVREICLRLEKESGLPLAALQALVRQHLEEFIEPVLFHRVVDAFRELKNTRPDLLHFAFLEWRQRRQRSDLMEQLGESPRRIVYLRRELLGWREETKTQVAEALSHESGVPIEILVRRVDDAITEWFGAT
jgi:hypothetical protein